MLTEQIQRDAQPAGRRDGRAGGHQRRSARAAVDAISSNRDLMSFVALAAILADAAGDGSAAR